MDEVGLNAFFSGVWQKKYSAIRQNPSFWSVALDRLKKIKITNRPSKSKNNKE
jgi:hypothetical protein